MSQNHFIKNLLNIKDKNINFSENYFSFENINGINTKIIHTKLTYSTDKCPYCAANLKNVKIDEIKTCPFFNILEIKINITEYQAHSKTCPRRYKNEYNQYKALKSIFELCEIILPIIVKKKNPHK